MKRSLTFVAALVLGGAIPAWGGTIVVPYAADADIHGVQYTTKVRVHNDSDATAALTYMFVPVGTSSVDFDRVNLPIPAAVAPHSTATFGDWVPEGQVGWLEIMAPAEISVTARLVGAPADGSKTFGTELPVVTPKNAVAAGQTTILQGLAHADGEKITDLVLLNLETELNTCVVEVFRSSGVRVLTQTVTQPGLISTSFPNVFNLVGLPNANDVTIALTCDQKSHAFAIVQQLESAQALYVSPAGKGDATSTPPIGTVGCSTGAAVCHERAGVFFTPKPGNDYLRLNFPVPQGTYDSLHFQVTVTNGGWANPTSGLNQMFWLARNGKNVDLYGFMAFRGPSRNGVLLRHGLGVGAGDKAKLEAGFAAIVGETYVLDYVFAPSDNFLQLTILDTSGNVLLTIIDSPNVNRVHIDGSGDFIAADFSFRNGVRFEEPPSFNWNYANLLLELFEN